MAKTKYPTKRYDSIETKGRSFLKLYENDFFLESKLQEKRFQKFKFTFPEGDLDEDDDKNGSVSPSITLSEKKMMQ